MKFSKKDYILSFWVQGVSVFVTDVHRDAYTELEALFVIDNGMFKQYFTKRAYERTLNRGLEFYGDKHEFDSYHNKLGQHSEKFREFFAAEVRARKSLSEQAVTEFFFYTKKLCGDYTKMNFEFTDRAFSHRSGNATIKQNLTEVAKFKDSVRQLMNTVLFEPDGFASDVFRTLGKQFDLSPSVIEGCTQREILALFEGDKPDASKVLKRQEAFVESYNLDGWLEGDEARTVLEEFRETVTDSNIIRGSVASRGKATGKVKTIPVDYSDAKRVNAEIEKMQEGDILVAETTAPELMAACRKAAAIVTDMGGLLSHAAIVSREFGIPCIVGTQNASKVLKDGDLVEVDAELGVVRVLHRATSSGFYDVHDEHAG